MHPLRISAVIELLGELAVDVDEAVDAENPVRQVIVNTHSPSVVACVNDDALLVAHAERGSESEVSRLSIRHLPGTWRDKRGSNELTVTRGDLLAYLSPLQAINDNQEHAARWREESDAPKGHATTRTAACAFPNRAPKMRLRVTLVTDGTSDVVLVPILQWLIMQLTSEYFEIRWADVRGFGKGPRSLAQRLTIAIEEYPCELLFVHRDAERQHPRVRYKEIQTANRTGCNHVCIVPVRMQEAWLLHNEAALREAAGRPSGTEALSLPSSHRWERLADPKNVLYEALRTASGAKGRRARSFKPGRAAHRLADLITDWSPLRTLAAFTQLEADTRAALTELGVLVTAAT